jgi:hypothetical protein
MLHWKHNAACSSAGLTVLYLVLQCVFLADVVVMLSRNLEYCSYAQTALFMTDDFDELEQKYNQVGEVAEHAAVPTQVQCCCRPIIELSLMHSVVDESVV